MGEVWKAVKDYETSYEVSNLGRVRSLDRCYRFRGNYMTRHKGRVLVNKITQLGYCRVNLSFNASVKTKFVHRLVMENFRPTLKELQVNHKDGDKTNNKLSNLEWCTPSENIQHAFTTGLREGYKSELHPSSKLSNLETKFIMYWLDIGCKGTTLSRLFDVSRSTISEIKTGKRRKNCR